MSIKNKEHYMSQLWSWGFLDQCFENTKIKVTDIDGFVERNSKFLVIETKSHDAKLPVGQQIMFEKMIGTGLFTVLVIWGEANRPKRCLLMTRKTVLEYNPVSEQQVVDLVRKWFHYADS